MFNLARWGRRPPSALAAIAIVFVVLALALIPGQMLARLIVWSFPAEIQSIAEPIVQNVAMFMPIYLGLWICLRLLSKRPFWTLGLERQHALRRALRGAVVAGLMMAVTTGFVARF